MTYPGIPMNNTFISTPHFAHDQTVLQKSEYDLQTALYNLAQIAKNYNFKISAIMKTGIQRKVPHVNKNCNIQQMDWTGITFHLPRL
jgi:hypothetical protein